MRRLRFLDASSDMLRRGPAPIIVTGAGGWLGQAALEMLDGALGDGLTARVAAFASAPRRFTLRSGRSIAAQPLAALPALETQPAIILHFAFLTRGHTAAPDYIATNRAITALMADYVQARGAAGLVVPSSGAVYGPGRELDSNLACNPYGVLKRQDEEIFGTLADRLGFPSAILRIFNLAGPFINNLPGYALACIIADVLQGGPITLRAAHPVLRSYTHVEDVLNIAMAIILRGLKMPVFDTAGELAVEIGELATRVSRLLAGRELPIERPEWRGGPANEYVGDFGSYRDAAARAGVALQVLDEQIVHTAEFLRAR